MKVCSTVEVDNTNEDRALMCDAYEKWEHVKCIWLSDWLTEVLYAELVRYLTM